MTDLLRASPFLRHLDTAGAPTGTTTVEDRLTGCIYRLDELEADLLDRFATERPSADASVFERSTVDDLRRRLLLIDRATLRSVAANAFGIVDLEVAGTCNAACVFCPRDALTSGRGIGIMRRATFDRVAAAIDPHCRVVAFAGIGEPTLNPGLPDFVAHFRQRGKTVSLVTNASLMQGKTLDRLVAAGLDFIRVSFTGTDKASYESNMLGLDYDRVQANVVGMLDVLAGRVPVAVSAVRTADNADALTDFEQIWRERGATPLIVDCHSRGNTVASSLIGHGARAAASDRCGLFNTRAFIAWTGRVHACCHDIRGSAEIGDLTQEDFWTVATRKLEAMRTGPAFDICATCDEPERAGIVTPATFAISAAPQPRSPGDTRPEAAL